MSDEVTIKVRKEDLWKYSTFVLAAVLIIGIIWVIVGGNSSTTNVNNNGAQANAGTGAQANANAAAGGSIDMTQFTDTSLYPSIGPANAKVVVIEFADFQCPYCAIAAGLANWTSQYESRFGDFIGVSKNIEEAAKSGDLKFIYVPMAFLGDESTYAAEAALCANDQGKFWEMHDIIFRVHDSQEHNGKYTKDKLVTLAAGVSGLNQATFKSCLEGGKKAADVQKATQTANSQGVSATPSFFLNGNKLSPSWAAVQAELQ
jgi:protein-disulfide isomerase